VLAAPVAAASRPGTLDRGFGDRGRVVTVVPGGAPALAGVASLRHGRTLVAGTVGDRTLVVLRYRRNGRLDERFGMRGVAQAALPETARMLDMVVTRRGQILLAGAMGTRAVVLRLDSGGRLDTGFGTAGIALLPFGGTMADAAVALALQPDARIVVAGFALNRQSALSGTSDGDLAVARLGPTGPLDPSFGSGGIARMPADAHDTLTPSAIAVLPAGRLLLSADYAGGLRGTSAALAIRLRANGSADAAFGTFVSPGQRSLSGGGGALQTTADLAVDARSGAAVVAGAAAFVPRDRTPNNGPAPMWVSSLRSDRFIAVGRRAAANAVTFDGRSRPLLAGAERSLAGESPRFAIVRLNRRDRPDGCFGNRGRVTLRFRGRPATADGIATGPRGSIVVAGTSTAGHAGRRPAFVLARLRGGNCRRR
jgi:uncharacterized delta-60 repeat protein